MYLCPVPPASVPPDYYHQYILFRQCLDKDHGKRAMGLTVLSLLYIIITHRVSPDVHHTLDGHRRSQGVHAKGEGESNLGGPIWVRCSARYFAETSAELLRLPVPPDAVEVGMMQEEEGVCKLKRQQNDTPQYNSRQTHHQDLRRH